MMSAEEGKHIQEILLKINSDYPSTLKPEEVNVFLQKIYPYKRMIASHIIDVAIFHLLRERNEARSFREFAKLTDRDPRILVRLYKRFVHENRDAIHYVQPSVESFIKRYCMKLELPSEVEVLALEYLEKFRQNNSYDMFNPHQCSSALIMLACSGKKHKLLKRNLTFATNLTQPTIKTYCEKIAQHIGLEYYDTSNGHSEKKKNRTKSLNTLRINKIKV